MSNHYFSLIEDKLSDGRLFVHGDSYSLSDPYLFVFASYLRMGDRGDIMLFPRLRAHRERVRARPAVERVLAIEGLASIWCPLGKAVNAAQRLASVPLDMLSVHTAHHIFIGSVRLF